MFLVIKLPPRAARVLPGYLWNGHMTLVKFVFYSVMTTVKQLVKPNGQVLKSETFSVSSQRRSAETSRVVERLNVP